MEMLGGRVVLDLPSTWRLLRRQGSSLQVSLDDPEEVVTLDVDLFDDLPLRPDGNFIDLLDPDADREAAVWQPGLEHGLRIARDHEGRGPHLLLVDCLPMGLTGLCRLRCSWPLAADLAADPGRVAALARDSVNRVGAVLAAARLAPVRPAPAPALPTAERAIGPHFLAALPERWGIWLEQPRADGIPCYECADEQDPYPCQLYVQFQSSPCRDRLEAVLGQVAESLAPGAREAPPGTRPGLLPLRWRPAGNELVLAERGEFHDGTRLLATERCVRARIVGASCLTIVGTVVYPAADRMLPATYALVEQLWRALLAGRFAGEAP